MFLYQGMDRLDAKEAIVDYLDKSGLLVSKVSHPMAIVKCSRTKDVIEYFVMDQW